MSLQDKLRVFVKQKRRRVALDESDDESSSPSAAGGGLYDDLLLLPPPNHEDFDSSTDSESSAGQPRIRYPELETKIDCDRLVITSFGITNLWEEVVRTISRFPSQKMCVRDSIPYEASAAFTEKLINHTKELEIKQLPARADFSRTLAPLLDAIRNSRTLKVLQMRIISGYQGMHSIGPAEAEQFADALAANTSLRVLDLSRQLEPLGIRSLSASLQINATLCFLDLSSCSLIAGAAEALAEALTVNASLQTLVLYQCTFKPSGVRALGQALSRAKLTRLTMSEPLLDVDDLQRQEVNECFGFVLRGLAFNEYLERVDLAALRVDEGILDALLYGISNNRILKFLDLRNNVLRYKSFYDPLANMLSQHVRLVVDVTGNRVAADALGVVRGRIVMD